MTAPMGRKSEAALAHSRLLELLDYNPATGEFVWKIGNRWVRLGRVAGCLDDQGYRRIAIDKRLYLGHRLAWFYVHGEWPEGQIDHISGNPSDNRIENLRVSDQSQNQQNKRLMGNSRSGIKGVHFRPRKGHWRACICIDGRRVTLGHFKSAEEAAAVYEAKAREVFGEFAKPDRMAS